MSGLPPLDRVRAISRPSGAQAGAVLIPGQADMSSGSCPRRRGLKGNTRKRYGYPLKNDVNATDESTGLHAGDRDVLWRFVIGARLNPSKSIIPISLLLPSWSTA